MAHTGTIPTLLLAARIDPLRDPAAFEAAYQEASRDRKRKVDRLRQPEDKRRSLGAERLLRLALRCAGAEPADLAFYYNDAGKPCLTHPEHVYFSLSHSGEYVLCAVSDREIGCDIQKITDVRLALAKRFFTDEEAAHIAGQPSAAAQTDLFFRYWTLKESFIKARGWGLTMPLASFRVALGEDGAAIDAAAIGPPYRGKDFGDIPGYRCAVCLPGDPADLRLQLVSLV